MIRIVPILIGVLVSYVLAACFGLVDFSAVKDAAWIGLPIYKDSTAIAIADTQNWEMLTTAIITIMPIALATMIEHIGDMCAISSTTGKNYLQDPGLHRTLMGDGLATCLSALGGGPANTTYGENTGVIGMTKIASVYVTCGAAVIAICLSCLPIVSEIINTIPSAVLGGMSIILYGVIASNGLRVLVDNQVDYGKQRNLIITSAMLVIGLGGAILPLGNLVTLSGTALSAVVGIALNLILPKE